MLSFTDLEVWKKARILRNHITDLVNHFQPMKNTD